MAKIDSVALTNANRFLENVLDGCKSLVGITLSDFANEIESICEAQHKEIKKNPINNSNRMLRID